jgi:predicted RNase H-like nuclease (RuvC/YqgF family)
MEATEQHLERIAMLSERLAILEKTIEISLHGKGGVLERMEHLDKCIDGIKKTIWLATGAVMLVVALANWISRH